MILTPAILPCIAASTFVTGCLSMSLQSFLQCYWFALFFNRIISGIYYDFFKVVASSVNFTLILDLQLQFESFYSLDREKTKTSFSAASMGNFHFHQKMLLEFIVNLYELPGTVLVSSVILPLIDRVCLILL
jgi:hypothetical protein